MCQFRVCVYQVQDDDEMVVIVDMTVSAFNADQAALWVCQHYHIQVAQSVQVKVLEGGCPSREFLDVMATPTGEFYYCDSVAL